jgi:precorrin-6Y C5,15-methyltransferase (decarboxylating)
MTEMVHVIGLGLGPGDLGPDALSTVNASAVLAGGRRLLDYFPDHPGDRLLITSGLQRFLDELTEASETKTVAVLASGDPNYYGIAKRIMEHLGPDRVILHPNVTTVGSAFARLKETWVDAGVVSLHGRGERALYQALIDYDKVAVYTDRRNTPAHIAKLMIERGQSNWRMTVLENLGLPEERIREMSLDEASKTEFADLNLVVLKRTSRPAALCLGLPDEAYTHQSGLITKAEVRAAALSKLILGPNMVVWDLGAGCGSVGLEAGLLARGGEIIAVEKDSERVEQIKANREKFGMALLRAVHGEILEALPDLPEPDRVFIGGGGDRLDEIVTASVERLADGGVIVASVVRLNSLHLARESMTTAGLEVSVDQVQVSRSAPLTGDVYFKALNPVYLVTGRKGVAIA